MYRLKLNSTKLHYTLQSSHYQVFFLSSSLILNPLFSIISSFSFLQLISTFLNISVQNVRRISINNLSYSYFTSYFTDKISQNFILNCLIHMKVILIYFTEHDIEWLDINGYCFNIILTQLSAFAYLIVIYNSLIYISFQVL